MCGRGWEGGETDITEQENRNNSVHTLQRQGTHWWGMRALVSRYTPAIEENPLIRGSAPWGHSGWMASTSVCSPVCPRAPYHLNLQGTALDRFRVVLGTACTLSSLWWSLDIIPGQASSAAASAEMCSQTCVHVCSPPGSTCLESELGDQGQEQEGFLMAPDN